MQITLQQQEPEGWNLQRGTRDEPQKFWNTILGTYKTKMNLHRSDGKAKMWRKKGSADEPKHTSSSVMNGGGNGGKNLENLFLSSLVRFLKSISHSILQRLFNQISKNMQTGKIWKVNMGNKK